MPKLSAVIITFNEERNIGRCLESIQGVVDDIVVVDSFSTDGTKAICTAYGVNFIEREWQGYSATKNFGNDQAKNDHILSLDADEALSPELKASILNAQDDGAYSFNRLTNYCGKWIKHGGWYPDVKLRIFDRRTAKWEGSIHEELVLDVGVHTHKLHGDLLHYSFYTVEEHQAQAQKFAKLKAEQMKTKGRTYNAALHLLAPVWKFIQQYCLKMGFLDGASGLRIARISAGSVAQRYKELKALNK